jgi:HTH-type transcriptional regulator, glycine betaine synthesis regulator
MIAPWTELCPHFHSDPTAPDRSSLDLSFVHAHQFFQKFLKVQMSDPPPTPAPSPLHEAEILAADAIGDIIEHWGFRKGLGRVWTVLFLAGEPMPALSIGERLSMSAGAVSMSLTELQRWGVVHRVWRPGERKEFFEAETDFWRMISKVFDERERLLAESVRGRLEKAVAVLRRAPPSAEAERAIDRLNRLLAFVVVAQTALDGFIKSRRVDFTRFGDLVRFPLRALQRRKGEA